MGKTFKKEVTQRTYPRGILFDTMAFGVGAYLGRALILGNTLVRSPKPEWILVLAAFLSIS